MKSKVYLTVGIDFDKKEILLVNTNASGGSTVIAISAVQARTLSRLLESCAGQLESLNQKKLKEEEE